MTMANDDIEVREVEVFAMLPPSVNTFGLQLLEQIKPCFQLLFNYNAVSVKIKMSSENIVILLEMPELYYFFCEYEDSPFFIRFKGYDSEYCDSNVPSHPSNNVSITCEGEVVAGEYAELVMETENNLNIITVRPLVA